MSEELPDAPASADLPEHRDDELLTLAAGAVWARLFFHGGAHPTSWDAFRHRPKAKPGRFDAFGAEGVDGVLYGAVPAGQPSTAAKDAATTVGAASALATCLAECAQPTNVLDRLDERTFVVAELTRPLALLDVSSDWATRAGAGAHLSTAPKGLTARWASAIASRWAGLDGIAYRSSVRPAGRAIVLWSPRARRAVETSALRLHRGLADPVLTRTLSWAADVTGIRLRANVALE